MAVVMPPDSRMSEAYDSQPLLWSAPLSVADLGRGVTWSAPSTLSACSSTTATAFDAPAPRGGNPPARHAHVPPLELSAIARLRAGELFPRSPSPTQGSDTPPEAAWEAASALAVTVSDLQRQVVDLQDTVKHLSAARHPDISPCISTGLCVAGAGASDCGETHELLARSRSEEVLLRLYRQRRAEIVQTSPEVTGQAPAIESQDAPTAVQIPPAALVERHMVAGERCSDLEQDVEQTSSARQPSRSLSPEVGPILCSWLDVQPPDSFGAVHDDVVLPSAGTECHESHHARGSEGRPLQHVQREHDVRPQRHSAGCVGSTLRQGAEQASPTGGVASRRPRSKPVARGSEANPGVGVGLQAEQHNTFMSMLRGGDDGVSPRTRAKAKPNPVRSNADVPRAASARGAAVPRTADTEIQMTPRVRAAETQVSPRTRPALRVGQGPPRMDPARRPSKGVNIAPRRSDPGERSRVSPRSAQNRDATESGLPPSGRLTTASRKRDQDAEISPRIHGNQLSPRTTGAAQGAKHVASPGRDANFSPRRGSRSPGSGSFSPRLAAPNKSCRSAAVVPSPRVAAPAAASDAKATPRKGNLASTCYALGPRGEEAVRKELATGSLLAFAAEVRSRSASATVEVAASLSPRSFVAFGGEVRRQVAAERKMIPQQAVF